MPAPTHFHPLDSLPALDKAWTQAEEAPVLLYKHSATCTLSARANQWIAQLTAPEDPPVYRVVVQNARPVSNAIAERLDLRHESPQAILLYQGEILYDASHTQIDPDAIRSAHAQAVHA